jgi:hypothetical protein
MGVDRATADDDSVIEAEEEIDLSTLNPKH